MAQDEVVLLQRFVTTGDAAAFSEIVRRHIGLVYSTCLRILADRDKAADATQETFFQFLKKANNVTGSVPAWLHRVATCKAVDTIRTESSRRRAEGRYADVKLREATKWEDLSPYVDQALDALDGPTQDLLIEYFFEGRTVTDIAADKAISRATVSRRLKAAVGRLRQQLRKRCIVVSAVTISSLLSENAAQAAPTVVLQELAKMALVGGAKLTAPAATTAATGSAAAATAGVLLAAKTKIILVAAIVGVSTLGVLTHRHFSRPAKNSYPLVPDRNTPLRPRVRSVSPPPVVEPEGAVVPAVVPAAVPDEPVQGKAYQTQPPDILEQPHETTQEIQPPKLDLSSPKATVTSFTKLMVAGDDEAVLACFLTGGRDYEDIQEILYADASDTSEQGQFQFQMRLWFQALDADAEMPVLDVKQLADGGVRINWQVTLKKDFALPDHSFSAGETTELSAELVERDGKWLFNSLF
ncbi:MAG: RNA polymerase sigma factor [Planctomycetota bacterium]|jgi:RNA polymerase sigma-70 factor (ECF subfamily)